MGAQLRAVLPPSSVVRYDCVDVVASATCASYPGDAIPDERDGSRAVVLAEFVEVQTQANLSTTALLQQRLRKVEKERDVARKIEGRIRQEIRRRETQESVADDAGWKSGGEG